MPKIEHIIGEGPELARSQQLVLEVMEKHPDHLFRLVTEDIAELQAWMSNPDAERPPKVYRSDGIYAQGTIRWAISTLFHRGKIGRIDLYRRSYYGSNGAIRKSMELNKKKQMLFNNEGKDSE